MTIERAVVTGASGFVGRALVRRLPPDARPLSMRGEGWREGVGAIDWSGATVFHLAARVHRPGEQSDADYLRDNAEKTRALAQAAAAGGAKRFVFVSTIKVNGEATHGKPFTSADPPAPRDAYARSKRAAETSLAEVVSAGAMTATILRVPLLYGAGARGNLASLLRLCDTPWPLPFAALHNRRSFLDVEDLASLLVLVAADARAAGRTFVAAHPQPASTARLVTAIRHALGRPARLFPVPRRLLAALAVVGRRGDAMDRLAGDLEVDATEIERALGWRARIGLDDSVRTMVSAYARGET